MSHPDDFRLIARLATALRTGEASANELTRRLGCAESACRRSLRTLRAAGAIHIGRWRTASNGQQEALFHWGEGDDADAPGATRRAPAPATLPAVPKLGPWGCVW